MCDARFNVLQFDDVEEGAPDQPFRDSVRITIGSDVHRVLLDNRRVVVGDIVMASVAEV